MFEIQKDDFHLQFDDIVVYESDLKIGSTVNGKMTIRVSKPAYSAISSLDINGKELDAFFKTFINNWDSLKISSCSIKEPYGDQFISLRFDGRYFAFSGKIGTPFEAGYQMTFSESMDQSYLSSFVGAIKKFDLNSCLS